MESITYKIEQGICLWESPQERRVANLATLSIKSAECLILNQPLNRIFQVLTQDGGDVVRYYTRILPFDGGKVQELRMIKTLNDFPSGFLPIIVERTDGIFYSLAKVIFPLSLDYMELLSNYRHELLLWLQSPYTDADLLEIFKPLINGVNVDSIEVLFAGYPDVVVARLYDDPCIAPSVLQCIGSKTRIEGLAHELDLMRIDDL